MNVVYATFISILILSSLLCLSWSTQTFFAYCDLMKEHFYVFQLLKVKKDKAGFKALTAATIKNTLLWVVTPCSLETTRRCGVPELGSACRPSPFDPGEASDVFSWAEISLPTVAAGL